MQMARMAQLDGIKHGKMSSMAASNVRKNRSFEKDVMQEDR